MNNTDTIELLVHMKNDERIEKITKNSNNSNSNLRMKPIRKF